MIVKQSILVIAALLVITSACKKEDPYNESSAEEKQMNITILNPQAGIEYAYNEVVSIEGDIHSNFDAHGYIVRYWNESNKDSLLYEVDGHEHGEHIAFSASWANNLSDTSTVRIEVIASSDHQGTYTEMKEVSVTCLSQ